jgi:hypothetical protein
LQQDALAYDALGQNALARTSRLLATWSLAALLALFGVATVFTLFMGRSHYITNESIYAGHYKVGQPGTVEWYTREGRGRTSFGEHGLVVNKELDPQRTRLLFVGDSFTMGRGVLDSKKYSQVIEQEWNRAHPQQIQTLNVGLGGLGIADYVHFAGNLDRTFEPHRVFIFLTADDFQRFEQFERKLERLQRPARRNPAAPALDLINDVGYYAFLRQVIKQTTGFRANTGFASLAPPKGLQPKAKPAETGAAQVATQLNALQQQWGDRLVIIYYSFVPGIGRYPTTACQDKVWQEIREQGIATVNLCPAFSQASQDRTPPAGFDNSILGRGHLNAYGHALVAAEVIEFLEAADGLH